MEKFYTSLGLMSGTSMDGIDASIIRSDGENEYQSTFDEFFEYDQALYKDLVNLRNKINSANDIIVNSELVSEIERKITLYHAEICNKIINKSNYEVDLIGFHGQTIFHDASQKISKQLGDGSLLSSLLKKDIIYNFRANDIANGGQGAPLAPIFHNLIINKNKIELPVFILNIGGIANITIITSNKNDDLISYDIGPGNCLLDEWVRKHTNYRYDLNGKAASIGKIDEIILNKATENFENINKNKNLSFDIKDFDLSFVRGLSYEDGLSTLTKFTSEIICDSIIKNTKKDKTKKINLLVCGGGRKNLTLIENITNKLPNNINLDLIDDYNINGDFIESQAFAYLAIRSLLKKEISFVKTTNVKKSCTGGILVKNY
ncbi:anhydro-N-acetylmuramic acid kinase [Candidatus Pelagibacter sp.]|nr:anhydro-N-acetylmuramic acid kinase [Candidatus Pelagibacter sp.]MDC1248161.1 anhydro-N-acetylmuramic acid kinase [Pelagibacteraceae bacterium]